MIDDLITLPQTKDITGISNGVPSIGQGWLHPAVSADAIGGKMGPRYLASEVQGLVERFRSMTNAPATSRDKALLTYSWSGTPNLGDVLVPVMKGRVVGERSCKAGISCASLPRAKPKLQSLSDFYAAVTTISCDLAACYIR